MALPFTSGTLLMQVRKLQNKKLTIDNNMVKLYQDAKRRVNGQAWQLSSARVRQQRSKRRREDGMTMQTGVPELQDQVQHK